MLVGTDGFGVADLVRCASRGLTQSRQSYYTYVSYEYEHTSWLEVGDIEDNGRLLLLVAAGLDEPLIKRQSMHAWALQY